MTDTFRTQYAQADGAWLTFPFAPNYQALGGGFISPQYKRVGSRVYLRGSMTRNTSLAAAGSTCGTMPVGYRLTAGTALIKGIANNVHEVVQIDTAGLVKHLLNGIAVATGYLSLDGIYYDID